MHRRLEDLILNAAKDGWKINISRVRMPGLDDQVGTSVSVLCRAHKEPHSWTAGFPDCLSDRAVESSFKELMEIARGCHEVQIMRQA